jgi:site-specific recombinase XerD
LSVWNSKFFKSRLIPVGAGMTEVLLAYHQDRKRLPLPNEERSAFFADPIGRSLSLSWVERSFVRLREHAGIQRGKAPRLQPRLHDLRHTFAVYRLVCWYREGADVQACLPLLSAYLGHANLSGTQVYLTMIPELLEEASRRFENYATMGKEEQHA